MPATATKTKTPQPVKADRVEPMEYVDDDAYYRLFIQIGARNRWRSHGGGRWEKQPTAEGDPERYEHKPAIRETEVLPGRIVNGLIAKHNKWHRANTAREMPAGDVSRQLLVLQVNETDERPARAITRLTPQTISDMLSGQGAAFVKALIDAGVIQKPAK